MPMTLNNRRMFTPEKHNDRICATKVIRWYRTHARDLPWRAETTSPWAVLLSEVMSQQTPVARVIPQWEAWMRRWPTPKDFAKASTDEVLRAWGSLGYPRRALRLLECAKEITSRYGGEVPSDVEQLLALPGIGDYTARAVACFAYHQPVPVVDTNVRRVYARMHSGNFYAPPTRKSELAQVAAFYPKGQEPECAVALMELGALVCTANSPDCEHCPIRQECAWQQAGCPEPTAQEHAEKKKRVQKFVGTDRQVRGKIMALLRESAEVKRADIDAVWPKPAQLSRALFSLIEDGLAEEHEAGVFRLPA